MSKVANQIMLAAVVMGCFTVILKPLGSLSTIFITRLLITIMISDQDTDSKYADD